MRKILLITFLTLAIQNAFASTQDDFTFKHHTFEVSVTPAVDYHFVANIKNSLYYKQTTNSLYRPFIGGNFGLVYTYRPIQFIGVSTGFNFTEFVAKMGVLQQPMDPFVGGPIITYAKVKGYIQTGYISVPLLLHGFYAFKKISLEVVTGPEFLFPVFNAGKFEITYNTIGEVNSFNETDLNNPAQMKQNSTFGWDVQLNANIPVKEKFYLAIGPEMKFLNIRPFNPGSAYSSEPHLINYYTGVKVSFRFPTDFIPKIHRNESSSPADR